MNISLCLVKFVLSLSNLPACENSIDLELRHESYRKSYNFVFKHGVTFIACPPINEIVSFSLSFF